jgi:prepilin-type N-terminal cleavage/methylation domain-containing protein
VKSKGFTLIELMIVLCIVGILVATVFGMAGYKESVNVECVRGFKYSVDMQGGLHFILDANGDRIQCFG